MLLKNIQKSYRLAFQNEAGKDVLADLRIFCHATKSVFHKDSEEMARLAGRQEVFQRIMTLLKVDIEEVYDMEFNEFE